MKSPRRTAIHPAVPSQPLDGAARHTVVAPRPLIAGTRASALALAQTEAILAALRRRHPDREFTTQIRKLDTEGDRSQVSNTPLAEVAGRGVFVRALEDALLAGEIDLAVHSLKDMPADLPAGLTIAAVGPREDVRDILVSRDGRGLRDLPHGARVGTGSSRRGVQIQAFRRDLQVVSLRGNIDTRIRKVESGEVDAAVLAAAGLNRMGTQSKIAEYLPPELFLPAVGQGAIAVEVRSDDAEVVELVSAINDPTTWAAVTAERAFLRTLGGGCLNPVAALGVVEGRRLVLSGFIAGMDGARVFRGQVRGSLKHPEALGAALAQQLLAEGANEVVNTFLAGGGGGHAAQASARIKTGLVRQRLERLIADLPDSDLLAAESFLLYLINRDPLLLDLATTPHDDEQLTTTEQATIEEAWEEYKSGNAAL